MPLIQKSPDVMSGTPVFTGTRVPVQALFDYLEEGHSLDEFLDDFPTVGREHAKEVLESAKEVLLAQVSATDAAERYEQLRQGIIAAGIPLLNDEEVREEIRSRKGVRSEPEA